MTILVLLLDSSDVPSQLSWATRFGTALEEDLVVACAASDLRDTVESELASRGFQILTDDDEPAAESGRYGGVVELEPGSATEIAGRTLDLATGPGVTHLLLTKEKDSDRRRRAIARSLFERAPCRVILLRPGREEREACQSILVAASGGPHASAALRIGARLALTEGGQVTPLYVEPPFGREAEQVGALVMKKILEEAQLGEGDHINPRVLVAADPVRGIARAAQDEPDLVLIGASEAGAVRRNLFGTIPDRCLGRDQSGAIAVVRERRPLGHRLRARLERWLDLTIPQLSRDERVSLFEKIRSGSSWRFDFMVLIALSTSIAALGLLQDSAAVVIGAMLVAPLMTPVLGAGLAVVQGNLPLLRSASLAIVFGFLTALGIGFLLGLAVPIPYLTGELTARGGPTLLDLAVACFSGLAAAYCLGRPTLSAALPGVAIAAALVPPIATAGVSLAHGEWENAQGAALLFGTNVVAIVLGAAFSLYAGGIRPKRLEEGETPWSRYVILCLVLAAGALSIPLGSGLLTSLRATTTLPARVRGLLDSTVDGWPGSTLRGAQWRPGSPPILELQIEGRAPPTMAQVASARERLRQAIEGEVSLRVKTELVVVAGPDSGDQDR